MKVFVVEDKEHIFDLNHLFNNIDVYGHAINKAIQNDLVGAGQYVVDACYEGDIVELKKNTKLYITLCVKLANELELLEAIVKKNS